LWSPQPVQLTSIVRQFERFLADPRVEVRRWFEPFVWLMHRTLGCEVAYVIIDCTQAGSQCRTLTAGLAYHGTIRPLAWQTHKGKKGHLKSVLQIQWGAADAQPLYLVSTLPAVAVPHRLYEQRYWIETFFASLKARGFHLERTHLTLSEQIDRLFLVVAIAACLVVGLASYRVLTQQTHAVDRSDRRDLSLLQLGFRSFFRLLALNRLHELTLLFSWSFRLPQPGFQSSR
jgi:hypothetical protein